MRWAKVREKAKKYAPLIALLYFFFLLNGERHENHVLQSELAQLDHHLEMEFTSTKDFLAGNLSSPDYHDSMIWEAEQLRTIASCGYYFQSSGFGADDAWLEGFSELTEFIWFITLYGVYGCNECKSTKKHRITDYSSN